VLAQVVFSNIAVACPAGVNSDGFDDSWLAPGVPWSKRKQPCGVCKAAAGFSTNLQRFFDINSQYFVDQRYRCGAEHPAIQSVQSINGDGFDGPDCGALVPVLPRADDYSAGEAKVVFGRDFTNAVTKAGTAGNDTFTGTATNDVLVGA